MTTDLYEFWKSPAVAQKAKNVILYTLLRNSEPEEGTHRNLSIIVENVFKGRFLPGTSLSSYFKELNEAGLVTAETLKHSYTSRYSLTEEGREYALSLDPENL
ncbi:MAG: hypothetical protein HYT70_02850 [Candidatus Aenigmarchaeota archaeon]|nr:hypothetical protein [Candidatus Aenigmarchaeota archaeon]